MPQDLSCQGAGMLFPVNNQNPIHKNIINPLRIVMWVEIVGPVTDAFQVKDDECTCQRLDMMVIWTSSACQRAILEVWEKST
jgi:hypothetical protein